jgi:hypothetical protein
VGVIDNTYHWNYISKQMPDIVKRVLAKCSATEDYRIVNDKLLEIKNLQIKLADLWREVADTCKHPVGVVEYTTSSDEDDYGWKSRSYHKLRCQVCGKTIESW